MTLPERPKSNRPKIRLPDGVFAPGAGVDPGEFYREQFRLMEVEMDELAFRAETFKVLLVTLLRMMDGTKKRDEETGRVTFEKILAMGAVHQSASMDFTVARGVNPPEPGADLIEGLPQGEFYYMVARRLTGKEIEELKKEQEGKADIELPPGVEPIERPE